MVNGLRLVAGASGAHEGSCSCASILIIIDGLPLTASLRVGVGLRRATRRPGVFAGAALLASGQGHHEGGGCQNEYELFHVWLDGGLV